MSDCLTCSSMLFLVVPKVLTSSFMRALRSCRPPCSASATTCCSSSSAAMAISLLCKFWWLAARCSLASFIAATSSFSCSANFSASRRCASNSEHFNTLPWSLSTVSAKEVACFSASCCSAASLSVKPTSNVAPREDADSKSRSTVAASFPTCTTRSLRSCNSSCSMSILACASLHSSWRTSLRVCWSSSCCLKSVKTCFPFPLLISANCLVARSR
mmetsp:Transcript_63306/g.125188  ORF Transcript_63306/g.125188 Transcript_63306/m.125188 type:complete len:216 (-) Transcript_63306:283-930(-)